jgi:predicted MPP superfamily phosphohydrolase
MDFAIRHISDLVALALALHAQWWLGRRWLTRAAALRHAIILLACAWVAFGFLTSLPPIHRRFPYAAWLDWFRAAGIVWGFFSILVWAFERTAQWLVSRWKFHPGRRKALNAARLAAVAAPAMAVGYGVLIERHRMRLTEVEAPVKGLPPDLDGLTMVQITDIHLGPYLSRRELERAVDMANETRATLALVTGDLITIRSDELGACLDALRGLRADSGVWGCLGNHEIYGDCDDEAARRAAAVGIRFLRGENVPLRFGSAVLNLAGVDYQRMRRPYLRGAERLVDPSAFNVLLSHNPDVFPVAARQGFHLTVAGHTHGGQVTVEILRQNLSPARFFTPYVYGLYEKDARHAWVGRGLGTVGVPARIGAPPEVALIRLCAT